MEAQLSQELEKRREQLLKALGQGERMQNLGMAPEWEFFIGWIEASKKKFERQIASDKFVNDHNGYLRVLGTIQALDMIIKGVDGFKKAYEQASKQFSELKQIEKDSKNG